jgi:integrase
MGVFKRNGNYWVDYYDADGRRHRKMIGPQKNVAKIALKDVKVKIAKGEYLGIYEEKKVLFRDFAEKTYIPYARTNLSPKTFYRCRGIIETHLNPYFDYYLYKISRKSIEEYKQRRSEQVEPATVNREFSRLRHMLKCALDWGYIKNNPCRGIKELKEPPGRIRYLSHEEMEKLLTTCDPQSLRENPNNAGRPLSKLINVYLRPIVEIALHSGMRRGEILGLRWKDIDFRESRIILEKTKNNERRTIYMNETLYQALKVLPVHLHSDLVFPDINGNMLSVAFERACKRAGVEDFRFHDLRHTFASYLTMGGANLRTVQTLLGHKDLRMTMRYSHLSPEHLKEAVTTLEKSLNWISNGHSVGTGQKERLAQIANPLKPLASPTGFEPVLPA